MGPTRLLLVELAALVVLCAGIAVWSWPAALIVLAVAVIAACEVHG